MQNVLMFKMEDQTGTEMNPMENQGNGNMGIISGIKKFITEASMMKLILVAGGVVVAGVLVMQANKKMRERREMMERVEKLKESFDSIAQTIIDSTETAEEQSEIAKAIATIKIKAISSSDEDYVASMIDFINLAVTTFNIDAAALDIEEYLTEEELETVKFEVVEVVEGEEKKKKNSEEGN